MKLLLSREYMSESYSQVRRYGTKWLLIEQVIGGVFIVLGIALYIYANGKTVAPGALVMIGVFELLSDRIKKYFWLRRHSKSRLRDAEVEIEVTESGINSVGPFSNGHIDWIGVERVVRTPNGMLVWPQKGIYWYIPESVAGKQAIDFIESKVASPGSLPDGQGRGRAG